MEGAVGTRSRLLAVLTLVAGLLVGGSPVALAAPQRALAPPTAAPAAPVAHAPRATDAPRTASRSGGAERAAVAAPGAPTSCGSAGGDCPPPSAAGLPEPRGVPAARLSRLPGAPPGASVAPQQGRAPPRPAGP